MMDGKSSQYDNSGYAMDGRQNTGYPPVMTQPGQSYPPPQEGGHYPPPGAQGYYPPPGAQGYYPPPGAQGYPVPGQHSMAPPPQLPPNCPPGLQYLTQIDQLLVKQTVEIFEAFTGSRPTTSTRSRTPSARRSSWPRRTQIAVRGKCADLCALLT